jgi:hypothetical protein
VGGGYDIVAPFVRVLFSKTARVGLCGPLVAVKTSPPRVDRCGRSARRFPSVSKGGGSAPALAPSTPLAGMRARRARGGGSRRR